MLEVDGFDAEIAMIQTHIRDQKHDLEGRGMPSELGRIMAVEAFKELGERVGTLIPKEENVTNVMQLKAGLIKR